MVEIIQIIVSCVAALTLCGIVTSLVRGKPFKAVAQDFFGDVSELCAPLARRLWCLWKRWWIFLGPRLTNAPTLAVILLDVYAASSPELRELVSHDARGQAVLLLLNLFARLSPRNAPQRVPMASPYPDGSLVNNRAIA